MLSNEEETRAEYERVKELVKQLDQKVDEVIEDAIDVFAPVYSRYTYWLGYEAGIEYALGVRRVEARKLIKKRLNMEKEGMESDPTILEQIQELLRVK